MSWNGDENDAWFAYVLHRSRVAPATALMRAAGGVAGRSAVEAASKSYAEGLARRSGHMQYAWPGTDANSCCRCPEPGSTSSDRERI